MGSWWKGFFLVLQMLNIVLFFCKGVSPQNITIVNDCSFTIWPLFKDDQNYPIANFELPKGSSRSFKAPTHLDAFLYSRTNCQSGSESSQPKCKESNNPLTLVAFKFRPNETDEYSVDTAYGFNLAVTVDAIGGSGSAVYSCSKAGCIGHVKNWCPDELRESGGEGCRTACQVYKSPDYCCSGSFSAPSPCRLSSYAKAFARVCPRSRILPYNNKSGIFTCEGADYIVRYCPAVGTFSTIELGGQLRSTDRLVSPNGTFMLGFYGKNYRFLGIWYTKDENTKMLVADLYKQTVSTSGGHALSIDPNTGDLIITEGGTTLRTITHVQSGIKPNVITTLGDGGHLRLTNKTSGTVLWQISFHGISSRRKTITVAWVLAVAVVGSFLLIILCYLLYKKRKYGRVGETRVTTRRHNCKPVDHIRRCHGQTHPCVSLRCR